MLNDSLYYLQKAQNFCKKIEDLFNFFVSLYLQFVLDLLNNHPELYDMFVNSFHIIQQSDRYWVGVSSDMLIE